MILQRFFLHIRLFLQNIERKYMYQKSRDTVPLSMKNVSKLVQLRKERFLRLIIEIPFYGNINFKYVSFWAGRSLHWVKGQLFKICTRTIALAFKLGLAKPQVRMRIFLNF